MSLVNLWKDTRLRWNCLLLALILIINIFAWWQWFGKGATLNFGVPPLEKGGETFYVFWSRKTVRTAASIPFGYTFCIFNRNRTLAAVSNYLLQIFSQLCDSGNFSCPFGFMRFVYCAGQQTKEKSSRSQDKNCCMYKRYKASLDLSVSCSIAAYLPICMVLIGDREPLPPSLPPIKEEGFSLRLPIYSAFG